MSKDHLHGQARATRRRAAGAFVLGLGALTLAAALAPALLAGASAPVATGIVAILLLASAVAFLRAWRLGGVAARWRAGARGEDALEQTLQRYLGDEYTLYRNLRLPGRRGDLDGVLLGPPGLVLLENKAYGGEFVLFGDRWYRATGPGGRDLRAWHGSPTAQADRNRRHLAAWLARRDAALAATPLHAVVVLSSGRVRERHGAPSAPVVPLDELPDYLRRLPRARVLTREDWSALAAALDALNEA